MIVSEWFLNEKRHREDGPAIEYSNGDKKWYFNGKLHRTDGPAIECSNGDKKWYFNGKKHRTDGPACEYGHGEKTWYIDGENLSKKEFNLRTGFSVDHASIDLGATPGKWTLEYETDDLGEVEGMIRTKDGIINKPSCNLGNCSVMKNSKLLYNMCVNIKKHAKPSTDQDEYVLINRQLFSKMVQLIQSVKEL